MINQEIQWLLDEKFNGIKSDAFYADCKRLALGEPLAYLIGSIPFLHCTIFLDSHPLIPRAETEYWVEQAISTIKHSKTLSLGFAEEPLRILDLCAGSGCIGVAVAKAFPSAHVEFSEIDRNHLPTITKNLSENNIVEERYTLHHTSLFTTLVGQYDFILTNPPYINESLKRTDSEVIKHEPHVALFGGKDGMELIAEIIKTAPAHLKSGGQLWIEHEPEQSAAIIHLAAEHGFSCTNHQDQYDVERFSILVLQ